MEGWGKNQKKTVYGSSKRRGKVWAKVSNTAEKLV